MTDQPTLYFLTNCGPSHWVIQHGGYDVAAFDNEADARAALAKAIDGEQRGHGEGSFHSEEQGR